MKIYKVSIQEGFELGMMYDPEKAIRQSERKSPQHRPAWQFIVTAQNATYRLSYEEGLRVTRTLSEWMDRLEK